MFLLMKGLIIYMSYNDIVFVFCCVLNIILFIIDGVVLLKTRKNKNKYEKHQYGISNFCFWAGFILSIIIILFLLPNAIVKRQLIEVIWYTSISTYCYVFSLFRCKNNKLTNSLFVLWSTILICLIVGAVINLLLIWSHKPRLSASDWLVGLIVPLLCSSFSWIQGFEKNQELEEKSRRTLGDKIFNYVKSMNERGHNPTKEDIENVFGKNVTSNINGMVQSYKDGAIFKTDSGVHKKGEPRLYLEEVNGGYVAHDKKE